MGWAEFNKPRGRWVFRYIEHGKTRGIVMDGVTTKRQAKKIAEEWTRVLKEERAANRKAMTLAQAIDRMKAVAEYSPRNLPNINRYTTAILDHFGDCQVASIDSGAVMDWIAELKVAMQNTTARHFVYCLSRVLATAKTYGAVTTNAVDGVEVGKVLPDDSRKRERRITGSDIAAMIAHCYTDHLRLFLILAWTTGGRASEILELEWGDIDRQNQMVTFRHQPEAGRRTKGKRSRVVHVTNEVIEQLDNSERLSPRFIFANSDGSRIKRITKGFNLMTERAGYKGVTPHTIRHSVASALAESGVGAGVVRDHLGHSDIRVTGGYIHTSSEASKEGAKTLTKLLSRQESTTESTTQVMIEDLIKGNGNVKKAWEYFVSVVERETGFEPATPSLGRWEGRFGVFQKSA